jgi:hypothetical protein
MIVRCKNFSVKLSILITIFIVISLSGCLSEWHGDSAKIVISLGGAGRYAVDEFEIHRQLEHEIVFTNANTGEKLEFKASGTTFEAYLTSGSWNITVYSKLNGEYYAIGSKDVVLKLGQNSVKIEMYEALFVQFDANGGSFKGENPSTWVPKYSKIKQPSPPPTNGGLYLVEWYYCIGENKTKVVFDFENDKITESITLYAEWGTTPPFSGTVIINGDLTVGQTLIANTNLNETGEISYQWKSSDTESGNYNDITGATSLSYELTENEVGNYIKVTVTLEGYPNSLTSAAVGPVKKQGTQATFTITFNANDDFDFERQPPNPIEVDAGVPITLPDWSGFISHDGRIFGGWNTNSNGLGNNYSANSLYTFNDNITLYAKWIGAFTNIADFKTWLDWQKTNTPESPYHVKLNVSASLENYTTPGSLGNVLYTNKTKYVILNLSGSSFVSIEGEAFRYCGNLTGVIIPDSVINIGQSAFDDCTNLASVTIPASVTSIGSGAFRGTSLISVTFAYGSNIADSNFSNAFPEGADGNGGDNLKNAYSAGKAGTYTRTSKTGTEWTKQVFTSINDFDKWFRAQPDNTVSAPYNVKLNVDDLTGIGDTLYACRNKFVYFDLSGSTLATISSFAFNTLESGDGSTTVYSCQTFTGITIPNITPIIDSNTFRECINLTAINANTANTSYTSKEGVLYNKDGTTLVLCPVGKTGVFNIPNDVTTIGDNAFFTCSKLTSISIPNSVTSIGNYAFRYCFNLTDITIPANVTTIGSGALAHCNKLTKIIVATDNNAYISEGDVLYDTEKSKLICYPGGKNGSFTIPDGVITIEEYAFEGCFYLTSVTIPSSVTSIGISAFQLCTVLTEITIPSSVTSIGGIAFIGCRSLTSVTFATESNIQNDKFGSIAFPEGKDGNGGDSLKNAYLTSTGGAGTYTRAQNGDNWTRNY